MNRFNNQQEIPMSISALKPVVSDIRADGHITPAEANTLTAPRNGVDFSDKDTFEVLTNLKKDIETGNKLKEATPATVAEINKKHRNRLAYQGLNKGGLIGGAVGLGVLVASTAAVLATATGGWILFAGALVVPAIAIGCLALAGFAALIGKTVGQKKAQNAPIDAAEVQQATPRVVKAAGFKKNALVQRGIKIAGIVGGSTAGAVALGALIFAGTFGFGQMAAGALLFGAPFIAVAGLFIAAVIGIGALGGYIHSKIKERNKQFPEGPLTASPEALEIINNTITSETPTA
jgi:MFS family permease